MNMKRKVIPTIAAFCLLAATVTVFSKQEPESAPDSLSPREAVGMARRINTAQAEIFYRDKAYAHLEQLIPEMERRSQTGIVLTDSFSGKLKNYRLSVIASAEGKHYAAAVLPQSACGASVFSDEKAVIHVGDPLGCPDN